MQHKTVHVNEADLIRDVQAFLNRVQEGFEIVIERDKRPVAVLRSAKLVHHTISECIALTKAHEEETASAPTLDLDFIEDLKEIVASRSHRTSFLGLILDSTLVINGERYGYTVRQILEQLRIVRGDLEMGLSVITVAELAHGVERARNEQRRLRRQAFVDELIRDLPIHSVSVETARIAGNVGGSLAANGVTVAFEDLMIAATALQLRFGVATANVRHFQVVPGLILVPS